MYDCISIKNYYFKIKINWYFRIRVTRNHISWPSYYSNVTHLMWKESLQIAYPEPSYYKSFEKSRIEIYGRIDN